MEDSEMFLGGFAGGFLARGLTHIGYGIYFTTSRLIGIDLARMVVEPWVARWLALSKAS